MFKEFKYDLSASIIVFFVALPLCLGIALASGAPLFSGIIAGVVGGIVVGIASGSALGVSGPAAGLVVIVFTAIAAIGSWEAFLLAVVMAGVIQVIVGYAKAGFIAYFFPSSVIKGMMTGIGILIIIKQFPYAVGYLDDVTQYTYGAMIVSVASLLILIIWDVFLVKAHKIFQIIQGPIVVVSMGMLITALSNVSVGALVTIPVPSTPMDFFKQFTLPDFSAITNVRVWEAAVILAIVASLETLLCVEATDKLDPYKRVTPTDRELKAQGLGNIVSGLCGGLPLTQVIIRSSANITFGAKTKLSTILHGLFLLISVATIASFLNLIPLASLATILIMIGYKLAKPELFKQLFKLGSEQFIPFMATVIGIIATDLLKGVCIGLLFGIFYTLKHSYRNAYYMKDVMTNENGHTIHHLVLAEEVSFFNKASIIHALESIPPQSKVIIDCSNSKSIAYDVVEYIRDYALNAKQKKLDVELINFISPAIGSY